MVMGQTLIIVAKHSTLDFCRSPEYTFDEYLP